MIVPIELSVYYFDGLQFFLGFFGLLMAYAFVRALMGFLPGS